MQELQRQRTQQAMQRQREDQAMNPQTPKPLNPKGHESLNP